MALSDSATAIGAVTRLLQDHLIRRGFDVAVGKPEDAADNDTTAKLNLFLYELGFDAHMRNLPVRAGEQPPLWLVLKYLVTAFDSLEDSDSPAAHDMLGRALSALQDLNFLPLDSLVAPGVRLALENNPEPLKVTFDDSTVDLLSKIMQGQGERYRMSMAFQVRPVMIVPGALPRGSLLVGVDYTTAPETIIGPDGVRLDVIPSMGARLHRVEPERFEAGATLTIFGDDVAGNEMEAVLGDVMLTIVSRRVDRIEVIAEGNPGTPIASGTTVSAGELPLVVRRRLSPTRTRTSNLLAARLLPTVTGAALVGGNLQLQGLLLGRETDDVMVLFYRETDGATVHVFDTVVTSANQTTLTVNGAAAAVPAGTYRAILNVNNQQAKSSPAVVVP
jgi:hypothetical protein